jgi:hypothetical protein
MIEDMTIRRLVPKTQQGYIRNVKAFAAFLGRSPGTASREDVRRFQLHLTSSGAGTPKINRTVGRMIIIETFEPGATPRYRPSAPTPAIRIDTSSSCLPYHHHTRALVCRNPPR